MAAQRNIASGTLVSVTSRPGAIPVAHTRSRYLAGLSAPHPCLQRRRLCQVAVPAAKPVGTCLLAVCSSTDFITHPTSHSIHLRHARCWLARPAPMRSLVQPLRIQHLAADPCPHHCSHTAGPKTPLELCKLAAPQGSSLQADW